MQSRAGKYGVQTSLCLRYIQAQGFDFSKEGAFVNAELFRRLQAVPIVFPQRVCQENCLHMGRWEGIIIFDLHSMKERSIIFSSSLMLPG